MTVVLSLFKIFQLPQGGSITIGAMVPIMVLAYCYNVRVGIIAGMIYGTVNMMIDPYFINPIQIILDYYISPMALGLFPLFKNRKIIGVAIIGLIGYVSEVISGVIFFASYAGTQNVWVYSAVYNLYSILDTIIAMIIIYFLPLERLKRKAT